MTQSNDEKKLKANLRQRKFYEANKDKIKEYKRKMYNLKVGKKIPSDKGLEEIKTPVIQIEENNTTPQAVQNKKRIIFVKKRNATEPVEVMEKNQDISLEKETEPKRGRPKNKVTYSPENTLLFESLAKMNEKNKPSSIKTYTDHLKTVLRLFNEPKNFLQMIKTKPDAVIKGLDKATKTNDEEYSDNTKKALFEVVVKLADYEKATKQTLEKYNDAFSKYKLLSEKVVEKKRENVFPTFASVVTKIRDFYGEDSKEFLISKMYEVLPVRDDFHLKIVSAVKDTNDKNENYIVKAKNKFTIVINKFKTDTRYDTIKKEIERKSLLFELITNFIKLTKPEKYLFGDTIKNSVFVSNMFKNMKFNTMGEGAISFFRKLAKANNDDTDVEGVVRLSKIMGHSGSTANNIYGRTTELEN